MLGAVVVLVIGLVSPPTPASPAQDVIDRIVSRVGAQFVTLSDLERCRVLRLLDAPDDSDEALQQAYENRILVLRDMARPGVGPINPPIQALAARRRRWEATLDPTQSIPDLLARAGMTPAALGAWLADDVRIAMYLDQRFGAVAGADRSVVIREFHQRLRRGAGLP